MDELHEIILHTMEIPFVHGRRCTKICDKKKMKQIMELIIPL